MMFAPTQITIFKTLVITWWMSIMPTLSSILAAWFSQKSFQLAQVVYWEYQFLKNIVILSKWRQIKISLQGWPMVRQQQMLDTQLNKCYQIWILMVLERFSIHCRHQKRFRSCLVHWKSMERFWTNLGFNFQLQVIGGKRKIKSLWLSSRA